MRQERKAVAQYAPAMGSRKEMARSKNTHNGTPMILANDCMPDRCIT
jgi:hypothetical protein